ncbi:MAG: cell division protein FtsL [Porticoccaceae bacterium]
MTGHWRRRLVLSLLWLAAMASSLAVVVSSHRSRQFYAEYVELQREEHQLQVEWGKYLLEQSAWAALSRVEKLAIEKLDMSVPKLDDVIMVKRARVNRVVENPIMVAP